MHSVSASLPSSTDVSDVSTLVKDCRTADVGIGEPCGETEGLRILDEFRKLYESRIEKIDRESVGESDRVSMKLQVMSDWIKDLGEQNTMLVHTVEDLEQAACSRVKLLEEKLKQSSKMVVDNVTRSEHSKEALNTLTNRVSQLEKDEEYLQQKIEYLQSDIRGLLEVIRRAHRQNVWSLEGIRFFEIQPEDIPVPDCICDQEQTDTDHIKFLNLQIEQLQENEKKMIRSQLALEGKVTDLTTELSVKDDTIKKYVSRLQCFCEKLKEHAKQTNQVIDHPLAMASDQDCNIILTPDILESVLDAKDRENKSLHRQLQDVESKLMVYTYENNVDTINLQLQLEEKCKKVQQLEDKVTRLEKEAAETKDTLTAEIVALEKQNYHANMGNLLKDDLIKEMRKGLKQTTLEKTLPIFRPCKYNSNDCVDVITKMKSSHESPEQFPAQLSSLLNISTQRKNDSAFLHDNSGAFLNYGKRSLSTINAKLSDRLINLQSHSRPHINIQAGRYKHIKNIDKKILQTARKLSPPCKDNNLQDRVTTNTYVYSTASHLQDNTNDTILRNKMNWIEM